jgi:hypothetical protein
MWSKPMNTRRRRAGYTLVEVLTAISLTTLIAGGALAMIVTSTRCFDDATTVAYTDTDAVIAMEKIVTDVREAKSVTITNDNRISVLPPVWVTDSDGSYYDRHATDTANEVDYYLSDSTGTVGRTGTWLWRAQGSDQRVVRRDVSDIEFEQDTARSVMITITVVNNAASGPKETDLTQRVVYLRNY